MTVSQGYASWKNKTYRLLTNWGAAPHQLTAPAKPLAFRYKRNTVAFLMHSQIAAITKDNCVCVFAVSVVADSAFGVLFVALPNWLSVDRFGTA